MGWRLLTVMQQNWSTRARLLHAVGVSPSQSPTHLLEEQRRYTSDTSTLPLPMQNTPLISFFRLCSSSWSLLPPQDLSIRTPQSWAPTAAAFLWARLQRSLLLSGHFCVGGGYQDVRDHSVGLATSCLPCSDQLRVRLLIFQELFVVEQQVSFAV